MSNLFSAQQLQDALVKAKSAVTTVTKQISSAGQPLDIQILYTPRRIYSRKGGELYRNNIIVSEKDTECKGKTICTLLSSLIKGTTNLATVKTLKEALSSNQVILTAGELEVASPLEIRALAAALQIEVGKEDYSQWLSKITTNPAAYGFPVTTTKKYLKQSGGYTSAVLDQIKQAALANGADPAYIATFTQDNADNTQSVPNELIGTNILKSIPQLNQAAFKAQFKGIMTGVADVIAQQAAQNAMNAPGIQKATAVGIAAQQAALAKQKAIDAAAAAAAAPAAPATAAQQQAALAAAAQKLMKIVPTTTAAPATAPGATAASKNPELDDFKNNSSLQYFIMTFFEFLRLNPEIYSSPSAPIQVMVPIQGRIVFQDHLFIQGGGSITDTILNTPSYSIQSGGAKSDLDRVEHTLKTDIKLYSTQLRFEVERLTQSMAGAGKQMDPAALKQLNEAIEKVEKSERAVLTTALLGHKFLEAHRLYKDANTDDATVSLQKLVEIANLLATQKDNLTRRNQQVARSISGALTLITPRVLYTGQL